VKLLATRRFLSTLTIVTAALSFSSNGFAQQPDDTGPPPEVQMTVIHASNHTVSDQLRNTKPRGLPWPADLDGPLPAGFTKASASSSSANAGGAGTNGKGKNNTDTAWQSNYSAALAPQQVFNSIPGIGWETGTPPDTNIAVGDTQVVEIVNTRFSVYDKTGNLLSGPSIISSIFGNLTNSPCHDHNGGDPIVLYDQIAHRWLISQLQYPRLDNNGNNINGVFDDHVCIAVSTSSDAAYTYNLYDFVFDPTGVNLPDYPKFGVWPDAYYFSANTFNPGFAGAQACAFDRNAMINGLANPAVVCFQGNTALHSLLPSNMDGSTAPPSGTPNFFLQRDTNALTLYKFHVDFSGGGSTFTGPITIPVSTYTPGCGGCIPQKGTTQQLETLSDRLMYRLSYRNFASYE